MSDWDSRFLTLAEFVAQWSKDPRTKVGAVLADPITHRVLGIGYNGFPRGVLDTVERLADRTIKRALVVHAELNAILNASRTEGGWLYLTAAPCAECAKAIVQAGISQVICPPIDHEHWAHWRESMENAAVILGEGGVPFVIFRKESTT